MKRRIVVGSFTLAFLVGVGTFAFYSLSRQVLRPASPASDVRVPEPLLMAPSPRQHSDLSSKPSAPPARGRTVDPPPEPKRVLVGITNERLRDIQQALPAGAQIYFTPVGNDKSAAAVAEADLDGDGKSEVIVVHSSEPGTRNEPRPPLSLSVLTLQGGTFRVKAHSLLTGGVLFNIQMNASEMPLAVADVTGDHHPKIIVASGLGASLGGELQVFRLQGNSLVSLSSIGGNSFRVQSRAGQSGTIAAQSRYRDTPMYYRWNGQKFVPTS